jgi:hypothetical protein
MAADVTINGILVDVSGNPVAGLVTVTLDNCGGIPPTVSPNTLVTRQVTAQAAGDGTWSILLYRNNVITPTTTFYTFAFSPIGSNAPVMSAAYLLNTAGTFNIVSLTPMVPATGGIPFVIVSGAAGAAGATGAAGAAGATGAAGSSNVPWIDIQTYGTAPRLNSIVNETTTATTVAGSPNVTIGAAKHFVNGNGICIWKAGAATSQSTPAAPTIVCPNMAGSQTLTYKIVGYDAKGGLTAASAAGTVATAPAVFGPPQVAISSISVTSNVCSVVLAAPLNNTVTAGMTLHVKGVTVKTDLNGAWVIASASDTQHVTFAVTSVDGSGTVGGASLARVSNAQIITAISRAATGVITITTAQNNHSTTQAGNNPTVVQIRGITELDLNGDFVPTSISGTSIVCNSGNYVAKSGTVTAGLSIAQVWEFAIVTCPALSGTTIGYYIYSDSPNPGGALVLIGKALYNECHFTDWGPLEAAGYVAPAYIPTAPPGSAQNQMFTSTVLSGGGSTSLVLNDNVTTSIGALGATIMYDDGPNLLLAAKARTNGGANGGVFLSPPQAVPTAATSYIFNSPVAFPGLISYLFGTAVIANEVITIGTGSIVDVPIGTFVDVLPQFGQRPYCPISGLGSPQILGGFSFTMKGLGFTAAGNGQCLAMIDGGYTIVENCSFGCNANSTSVGLVYNGACTSALLRNLNFNGTSILGAGAAGPQVPVLWFRASDNPTIGESSNANSNNIYIQGTNTFNGRAILFDQKSSIGGGLFFTFGDEFWNQAASQPLLMLWDGGFGGGAFGWKLTGVINDSAFTPAFANWGGMRSLEIDSSIISGNAPLVTGNVIGELVFSHEAGLAAASASGQTVVGSPVLAASLTTTAATTDVVSIPGALTTSHYIITPTNAAAATDVGAGNVYISAKGANQVTITHTATSGMTFDILGTVN